MHHIIVGCGRVGAALAYRLFKSGHHVTVIDANKQAFTRLHPEFRGRILTEDVLKENVLLHAGIEEADGLAAVTNFDALNAVVAYVARTFYNVPLVVARNYDPALRPMLEAFGLQIVSSTAWGAQKLEELLSISTGRTVFSAGNGEVEIYEMVIPAAWSGKTLGALLQDVPQCIPVALTRSGRSEIPGANTLLQEGDLLLLSATYEGLAALNQRLSREEV